MISGGGLEGLIEMVEKATGPDRQLDLDLARALVPDVIVLRRNDDDTANEPHTYWEYTGSTDAALALVEKVLPGWVTSHHQAAPGRWHFYVKRHVADREGIPGPHEFVGIGSPPLAICLALLRALGQVQ